MTPRPVLHEIYTLVDGAPPDHLGWIHAPSPVQALREYFWRRGITTDPQPGPHDFKSRAYVDIDETRYFAKRQGAV